MYIILNRFGSHFFFFSQYFFVSLYTCDIVVGQCHQPQCHPSVILPKASSNDESIQAYLYTQQVSKNLNNVGQITKYKQF